MYSYTYVLVRAHNNNTHLPLNHAPAASCTHLPLHHVLHFTRRERTEVFHRKARVVLEVHKAVDLRVLVVHQVPQNHHETLDELLTSLFVFGVDFQMLFGQCRYSTCTVLYM